MDIVYLPTNQLVNHTHAGNTIAILLKTN